MKMKKFFFLLALLLALLLTSCSSITPYIGENGNWWVGDEDLGVSAQGPQGEKGSTGLRGPKGEAGKNGKDGKDGEDGKDGTSVTVTSVKKTKSEGAIDTYTIYFSDGKTTTFTVQNGVDGKTITIASVEKIGTEGLLDTYKVTFSDASYHTFTVKNGEDGTCVTVESIGKTNSVGLVDTYEIVFSDGTRSTFSVTNGRDGDTPYIGINGNWWIGDEDTGVSATIENMDRVGTDGLLFRMTIRGGVAGYEVYGYSGTETDIVIPNYIFEMPVVSIMQNALPTSITSLSISSNTEYLPEFEEYTNLRSFDFNNAPVSVLADKMFCGCDNLREIKNYGNIEVISRYAFAETQIVGFDFSNVTSIGAYAFDDCNITGYLSSAPKPKYFIYIPSNVTEIGENAFDDDLAVYYAGASASYTSDLLYLNVKHSESGYYYIDNGLDVSIVSYDGESTAIVIPKTIDNKPVTAIADYAFYANPYVERVEIPDSVKTVGKGTFYLCKNLYGVFVPSSVESCGSFSFFDDFLEMQEYGFENTTIFFEATSFDYPGGVTAPSQLGLVKYMVGVKPAEIVADSTCVYIKKLASYDVVTIKNNPGAVIVPAFLNGLPVSRINTYALCGNTLTRMVTLSKGIDKISKQAFYKSSSLYIVNVPSSVDIVNYYAFYSLSDCEIHVEAAAIPTEWDSSWYYSIDGYILNSQADYSTDGIFLYEIVDEKLYIRKYLLPIATQSPIIIPEKIDGKTVYGVRSYAFEGKVSSSSSNRYIFVIPSTITVMEQYAINIAYSYYSYAELYMSVEDSSGIPSTWHSSWYYTYYGYKYDSSYNKVYYKNAWILLDNVPTLK